MIRIRYRYGTDDPGVIRETFTDFYDVANDICETIIDIHNGEVVSVDDLS